jgi:hypothetical protein
VKGTALLKLTLPGSGDLAKTTDRSKPATHDLESRGKLLVGDSSKFSRETEAHRERLGGNIDFPEPLSKGGPTPRGEPLADPAASIARPSGKSDIIQRPIPRPAVTAGGNIHAGRTEEKGSDPDPFPLLA